MPPPPPPPPGNVAEEQPWEYTLRKYLLLLATLVATVAYGAGFSPPGGVWTDAKDGVHLAGDPVIRDHYNGRYLLYFYCNATAFVSSLVVIVLILLFAVLHEKRNVRVTVMPLRAVMVLDLVSLMGAYAAGTCRDRTTTTFTVVLVSLVVVYVALQVVLASLPAGEHDGDEHVVKEKSRKVLLLLATFATSLTYVAGLSTPGGFWSDTADGHRAGDAVMGDRHPARLTAFLLCNTTAFVASLLVIVLLLDRKLRDGTVRAWELYGCVLVSLAGLVGAYAAGSSRAAHTTAYVVALIGAILAYIAIHLAVVACAARALSNTGMSEKLAGMYSSVKERRYHLRQPARELAQANDDREKLLNEALEKARSLVLLLATLAATITYQAVLDPPGGYWQDDKDGHKPGDPILLTINARRYKTFFYFNSTAFVASLLAIILVQSKSLLKRHALEAAMILDLFGLMGAYAAGSCRDASTSINVMAIAGAVLVYVVIHIVFFTLDHNDGSTLGEDNALLEKRRKRLLLFAILCATITYQAGLTPPSGCWQDNDEKHGYKAGHPVLFSNHPRRYKAFFYCNTTSFMSSIALIILLINPNLYRPAIHSYALSVCMVAGMFGLMGAYAAGSSQHMRTSIYIFVLLFIFLVLLLVAFVVHRKSQGKQNKRTNEAEVPDTNDIKRKQYTKRKNLMLLGILAASVTYQAGLHPPGGVWQSNDSAGHAAGDPVLHDMQRLQYRAFFYSNSTSFMASIIVIILLLPESLKLNVNEWLLKAMNTTVVLDMIGLLVAYGTGSSRDWDTSGYVIAMAIFVLGYIAIHAMLSKLSQVANHRVASEDPESQVLGNGLHQVGGICVGLHPSINAVQ
uniref:PGG domain-containing protein n=1 Tax=Oryza nivara TaxID=4536 RepID=A0A0E0HP82_ORYNI